MWYIVLGAISIGLGAFGMFRFRVQGQLNKRIETRRALGIPMSLVEMNTWYRKNYPEPVRPGTRHLLWPDEWTYRAKAAGVTTLLYVYRQPWAAEMPPVKTHNVQVIAEAPMSGQ